MKCTKCGADIVGAKFCMYCGTPVSESHVTARSVRAHSGIMRFKQRASISQSALPEVQTRQTQGRIELESLKRSSGENRRIDTSCLQVPEKSQADAEQSSRQSRELEALLLKLNGAEESVQASETDDYEEENASFSSLDIDMEEDLGEAASERSLDDGFFMGGERDASVSGPIPVGSGTFSKTPSGGFHLVLESIRTTCANAVERVRGIFDRSGAPRSRQEQPAGRRKKIAGIAAAGAAAAAVIGIIAISAGGPEQAAVEPAAQAPVTGNEDFAIVPLEEETDFADVQFDADEFAIPALEDDGFEIAAADPEAAAAPLPVPAPAAAAPAAAAESVHKEKRLYGRKDNVLAADTEGRSFKTNKYCIMREGPASRFGLVKQIPVGGKIEILTTTDEDWVLEKGGLWKKGGAVKLGPGAQFADAAAGMSLPQPKSRVISASNWKYVRYGDIYGYVGPACFK